MPLRTALLALATLSTAVIVGIPSPPEASISAANAATHARYIVRVRAQAANERLVRHERWRGTRILYVYRDVFPGFAALLTRTDAARLRRNPVVVYVTRAGPVRPAATQRGNAPTSTP